MSIVAHQAYYGIQEQRHALLAVSGATDVFDRLYPFTDRPDSAPHSWPPYYSGFPFEEFYVVMRTTPDISGLRNGMVFTHAILLPKSAASQITFLESVLQQLVGPMEKKSPLHALVIPTLAVADSDLEVPDMSRLAAVAHHLVEGDSVVWLGEAGFRAAINHLWIHVWPAARVNFSFGISFNPQDLVGPSSRALVMGIGKSSRHWSGCSVVTNDSAYKASTEAEKMLLGQSDAKALWAFMSAAGLDIDSLKLLPLLEVGLGIWSRLATASFEEVLHLARIVTRYGNPDNTNRDQVLNQVLTKLAGLMSATSVLGLLSTRNLHLVVVPSPSVAALQAACRAAINQLLKKTKLDSDEIQLVQDALIPSLSEAQLWWITAAQQGCRDAFKVIANPNVAKRIWYWWSADPRLVATMPAYLPPNSDEALAAFSPTEVGKELAAALLEVSTVQAWLRLHAVAVVALISDHEKAVQLHIKVDSDPQSFVGINILSQRIPPAEFIGISLQSGADIRIVMVAAQLIVATPSLLQALAPSSQAWRQLWMHAVMAGAKFWPPHSDHNQLRDELLEAALETQDIPVELWTNLAQQPEADLTNYARRAAIWRVIPAAIRATFLQRTAACWVKQMHAGKPLPNPEPELSSSIMQADNLLPYEGNLRTMAEQVVHTINRFPNILESRFISWLQYVSRDHESLPEASAVQLGGLIRSKNWRDAARTSAILAHRFPSWEPMMYECKDLLSFFDKLGVQIVSGYRKSSRKFISKTEWWSGLQDTTEHVFGNGPNQENLWNRAGGETAKLLTSGTGSEQWAHALHLLRTGGGGKHISLKSLLEEMNKSRPNNDALKNLLKTIPA